MSKEIIEGYKGIMDLDLTNIPENLKKDTVEQHMKDIDNYKIEQALLPIKLRYDNTIARIEKLHKYEREKQEQYYQQQRIEQIKRNEIYINRLMKKN